VIYEHQRASQYGQKKLFGDQAAASEQLLTQQAFTRNQLVTQQSATRDDLRSMQENMNHLNGKVENMDKKLETLVGLFTHQQRL
jgi:phage shock protein A